MKTEVSADSPLADATMASVVDAVEAELERYASRLTRAEVHLKNLKRSGGRDVECTLEVRPASREPVVVKSHAADVLDAANDAAAKMTRLLDSAFGKADSAKGGPSASGNPT